MWFSVVVTHLSFAWTVYVKSYDCSVLRVATGEYVFNICALSWFSHLSLSLSVKLFLFFGFSFSFLFCVYCLIRIGVTIPSIPLPPSIIFNKSIIRFRICIAFFPLSSSSFSNLICSLTHLFFISAFSLSPLWFWSARPQKGQARNEGFTPFLESVFISISSSPFCGIALIPWIVLIYLDGCEYHRSPFHGLV